MAWLAKIMAWGRRGQAVGDVIGQLVCINYAMHSGTSSRFNPNNIALRTRSQKKKREALATEEQVQKPDGINQTQQLSLKLRYIGVLNASILVWGD